MVVYSVVMPSDSLFPDNVLNARIAALESAIQKWATAKDLWFDCGFSTYSRHVDAEPQTPPVVSMFWFEGPLHGIFNGFYEDDGSYEEFAELVTKQGFDFEQRDGTTIEFYASDEALSQSFQSHFNWQWICSLIQSDCADVYEELYSHFAKKPHDLSRLPWRDFEILLFRIFQNHGFTAELGPGRGDGGIDIRLLQRDPIGDMLTLVQAKRYAPRRKIKLEAVAALHGVATVEKADRSIFVTTSNYEPVAKRFAERTSGTLQLKTSTDVAEWCAAAAAITIKDKSSLVSANSVQALVRSLKDKVDPRIVGASGGYNMVVNEFALIIKETKHAALLMRLPSKVVTDDGYGQRGTEIPLLDETSLKMHAPDTVWRAKRAMHDGRVSYWDGRRLFYPWNGRPALFDYVD